MKTIMFVERPENKGRFCIDYHLNKYNLYHVPEGLIRIARFENIFGLIIIWDIMVIYI